MRLIIIEKYTLNEWEPKQDAQENLEGAKWLEARVTLWEQVLHHLQLFPPYPLKTVGGG